MDNFSNGSWALHAKHPLLSLHHHPPLNFDAPSKSILSMFQTILGKNLYIYFKFYYTETASQR